VCALASADSAVGHHAKAIELAQRAVDAFPSTPGAETASVDEGRAAACLGAALSAAGRDTDAIAPLERGSEILSIHTTLGDASAREKLAAEVAYYRTWVRGQRGADRAKIPKVLSWERTAIAESTDAFGATDGDTLEAETVYAETLAEVGNYRDAIAAAQPAADEQERTHHRARAVEALAVIARSRLATHDPQGALAALVRADAIDGEIDPALRARISLLHAQLAYGSGAVDEASAYEYDRRNSLAAANGDATTIAALDAWIAAPKGPPP